jgi:starch synthase
VIRVLFVTPEVFGLASTGGLGDVSAALPAALGQLDIDARVMMPGYRAVFERASKSKKRVDIGSPGGLGETAIVSARMPESGVPLFIVDCPALFDRPGGPYGDEMGVDWPDNARRFSLLCRAAALVAGRRNPLAWSPNLVHANDWQGGLLPALLQTQREGRPPTVFSIHNLAFLGEFPASIFGTLGLPQQTFDVRGVEFFGGVSLMKAGISYADRITTVSPTYAREIQTPEFGCGLDGLLRERSADLIGILNGVDYARWNPQTDPHIARQYGPQTLEGKRVCKAALQSELGLAHDPKAFLVGSVSRLVQQKGLDLLLSALPALASKGIQFAILGSGETALEKGFAAAASRYAGRVGFRGRFDDALAHRIEAGADAFIMPSRFEPCGLNQMYSLRYGTPPIVRRVGGLADTVKDAIDGIVFGEATASALSAACVRAQTLFADDRIWNAMQLRGMSRDFSWTRSAQDYAELYRSLLPRRKR